MNETLQWKKNKKKRMNRNRKEEIQELAAK